MLITTTYRKYLKIGDLANPWLRLIALPLLLALASCGTEAPATQQMAARGVVYHIADSDNALAAIRHIHNQHAADPEIQITVVAVAGGIDFLLDGAKDDNGNTYAALIDGLMLDSVKFKVCRNTLNARNLKEDDMTAGAEFVDYGIVEITRLQQEQHYAYIKP